MKEYHHARSEALLAKQRGDKKNRDYYGAIINKLKQEMSSLGYVCVLFYFRLFFLVSDLLLDLICAGLSHDILLSELQEQNTNSTSGDMSDKSIPCEPFKSEHMDDFSWSDLTQLENEPVVNTDLDGNSYSDGRGCAANLFENDTSEQVSQENEEPMDLELDNLFSEDPSSSGALPHEILKQQKKEKLPQLMYGGTLLIIDDIWRKVAHFVFVQFLLFFLLFSSSNSSALTNKSYLI